MKKIFCALVIFSAYLTGAEEGRIPQHPRTKSPEEIKEEIDQAQTDFEIAQKMFTPWYTGPLITGSAHNVLPGQFNFQPYLFWTVDYGIYNGHRKQESQTNIYFLNPFVVLQTGITNWLDVTTVPSGYFRWSHHSKGASEFAVLPLQFGLQITKETPYIPSIRLVIGELFPTGNYQRLDPSSNGIDATGQGAFQTTFSLFTSKVFWWMKLHPIAMRFAANFNVANGKVKVHGNNAYGGGLGTHGKVSVGNSFAFDYGIEVSLTQKWVFATDLTYNYNAKSSFSGNPGFATDGSLAFVGQKSGDQLALAPAIEYNLNDSSGFIGGAYVSVYGRNSTSFASIVFSYYKVF